MVAQSQGPLDCSALLLSSHHRPAKLLQTMREAVVRIKARSPLGSQGSHWVPFTLIVCLQSEHPGLFQLFSELCIRISAIPPMVACPSLRPLQSLTFRAQPLSRDPILGCASKVQQKSLLPSLCPHGIHL